MSGRGHYGIVTTYYFVDFILLVVYQHIGKLEMCLDLSGWVTR